MPIYKALDGGNPQVAANDRSLKFGHRRYPTRYVRETDRPGPHEEVVIHFEASEEEAPEVFRRIAKEGCLQIYDAVICRDGSIRNNYRAFMNQATIEPEAPKFWRFRDVPHYLSRALEKLGWDWRKEAKGQQQFKKTTNNPENRPLGDILGELRQRYFDSPKHGAVAKPNSDVMVHATARLAMAEEILDRIVVQAVAFDIAIAEAFPAWGLERGRTFSITTATVPVRREETKDEPSQQAVPSGKPNPPDRAKQRA